jgi:uncharacterized membrane protein (Fun14 family)
MSDQAEDQGDFEEQSGEREPVAAEGPETGHWGGVRGFLGGLPLWNKALLGLASLFLILGGVSLAMEKANSADAHTEQNAAQHTTQQSATGQPGAVTGLESGQAGDPSRNPLLEGGHTLQPGSTQPGMPETRGSSLLPDAPSTGPAGPTIGGTSGNTGPDGPSASNGPDINDAWSAGFFRLGFSFFAGFSIGLALRTIFRVMLIGIGIGLLFLFVLEYLEYASVDWDKFDALFESMGQRIAGEAEKFRTFLTGSLPSAGLAATGLIAGLRRKRG